MAIKKKMWFRSSRRNKNPNLSYFGLPNIFQSDNGTEFVNHLVEDLIKKEWRGKCTIIHERPRWPQSQGLVEQSNGTMKTMLASMMLEEKTDTVLPGFLSHGTIEK